MNATFDWIQAITTSPVFMVLVLCSIITLGVTLERAYYYWKRRGNPERSLAGLFEGIRRGELKEALWTCQGIAHPVGRAAREVLDNAHAAEDVVEERLMVCLSQEKLLFERNLGVLGTMATTCPLIGLLGTVWGIMHAFRDMSLAGSAAPTIVAGGVAEALITTAAGLVVAIPASVIYNHFTRRMNVMLTEAENNARRLRVAMLTASPATRTGTDDAPMPARATGRA